jgi:hypothetical protein
MPPAADKDTSHPAEDPTASTITAIEAAAVVEASLSNEKSHTHSPN